MTPRRDANALAILSGLGVAAFLWRLLYVLRLQSTPLGDSLTQDARVYWAWAGDILARGPVGHQPFFFAPLYPYALALVRLVAGDSIRLALIAQCVWGAAAVVLLADAARRLTNLATGVFVGVLVGLYEMAVLLDGLVLAESLLFLLESLLLWLVVRVEWRSARTWKWTIAGALIGLLAEGRATNALLLIPLAMLAVAARANRVARLRAVGVALLGFALVTLPVAVRTKLVSGEWIYFTYNSGYNLYVGNNPEATGAFVWVTRSHASMTADVTHEAGLVQNDGRDFIRATTSLALSPKQSSAWWTRRALDHIAAHPMETLRLSVRKVVMLWNRREYPQIENLVEYRMLAGPLGVPLVSGFAFLGTLGLAGLLLLPRDDARARFLLHYALAMTLGIVPFFVTDRYRHHLVPALALLAGFAVFRIAKARRSAEVLRAGAALLAGLLVVNLPAPANSAARNEWSIAVDMGSRWLERGRPDLALEAMAKAVELDRGASDEPPGSTLALERASFYYNYAVALARVGRRSEALAWYERAVRYAPENGAILHALADEYRAQEMNSKADSLYARLPDAAGGQPAMLVTRGWQAARAGRLEEAAGLFEQSLEGDPQQFDTWGALVRVRIQLQQLDRADAALARARRAGLPLPSLLAHEALLAALRGRREEASRKLAEIPESAIRYDAALSQVVQLTRGILARP